MIALVRHSLRAPQSVRNDIEDDEATMIGFGLATFRRAGWASTFRPLDMTEVSGGTHSRGLPSVNAQAPYVHRCLQLTGELGVARSS